MSNAHDDTYDGEGYGEDKYWFNSKTGQVEHGTGRLCEGLDQTGQVGGRMRSDGHVRTLPTLGTCRPEDQRPESRWCSWRSWLSPSRS